MYGKLKQHLQNELHDIKEAGLYKQERIISSPQGAEIILASGWRKAACKLSCTAVRA